MAVAIRRRVTTRPYDMQRKAEVCIVVPVFNYGKYLESCLRSALGQEGVDLTVLVLDDSSTDDSLSIALRISDEDPRVQVIAHSNNMGHIPTVNEGIAAANSEYVVKLDADDMLTEGSLKRSVALFQAFPSVGFVYGRPSIFIGEGPAPQPRSYARIRRSWTVWNGQEWLRRRFKRGANCIHQPEAAIRLSALREVGPYREELPHTSDFEMWMRLATRYDVGRINGSYQGWYRKHSASMSRTVNGGLLTDASERARAFDSLISECSEFLPDASLMSDMAYRAIARQTLSHAISLCTRGVSNQGSLDEYAALALKIYNGADSLREWRLMSRLNRMNEISERNLSLMAREELRNFRHRLQWWRWWWSGV